MKIVFNTDTGFLTIDGRLLKLATDEGHTSLDGLAGNEEQGTLAGMVAVRLVDELSAIQQAQKIAESDANYEGDPWSETLSERALDLLYEKLA